MDDDPWADTPPTPRTGTPRVSLEKPVIARQEDEQEEDTSAAVPDGSGASPSSPLSTRSGDGAGADADASDPDPEPVPKERENSEQEAALPPTSPPRETAAGHDEGDDGFDDFDDFDNAPEAGPSTAFAQAGDDGFGDFGDFEEGDFDTAAAPEAEAEAVMVDSPVQAGPSWRALNLRPFPTTSEMLDQLGDILQPLVPPAGTLSDEPVRSVGGLGQVMVAESSRDVYAQLTTAPMLKPLDWTRSRVRREHLISMGVPVNLDEVDSHRLSALPPLRITTEQGRTEQASARRAQSLDVKPNGTGSAAGGGAERPGSALSQRDKGKGRQDTPASGSGSGKYGLGEKPGMDMSKAEELCGIEEDRLGLLPLATLRQIQDQLVTTSAQASASLAWSLQLKDAQTQDSATYNGMISGLISNAAKAKSAQQAGSGGGVFRRSSQKVPPRTSGSGASTPRVASPAMR